MNELVSIILPCFNAREFLDISIQSVIQQNYLNWELIIVDDHSTDNSVELIKEYCSIDQRIKLIRLDNNTGSPVEPRNIGITNSNGRYIAFIDSDDIWCPSKLSHQIPLFQKDDCAIVYSNYMSFTEQKYTTVTAPEEVDYHMLLKGNVIACSSAIYDRSKAPNIYFKNVGHEDFLFWLTILKLGYKAYNSCCIDFKYRIVSNSLSSNKFQAILWHWNILFKIEQLSLLKSIYYFLLYLYKAIYKRL